MSKKPTHWRTLKLTETTLYMPDRAMLYWSQFSAPDFIRLMVDEMGREVQSIDDLIQFLLDDPDAAALTLADLSHKMSVQEICELILRRTRKTQALLDIACNYANLNQTQ
jgi:hypothetical protein